MNTIFESEQSFENAAVMLDACRETFEKNGLSEQARQLKGLEATSPSSVEVALFTLKSLPVLNGEAAEIRRLAIRTLSNLLGQHRLAS